MSTRYILQQRKKYRTEEIIRHQIQCKNYCIIGKIAWNHKVMLCNNLGPNGTCFGNQKNLIRNDFEHCNRSHSSWDRLLGVPCLQILVVKENLDWRSNWQWPLCWKSFWWNMSTARQCQLQDNRKWAESCFECAFSEERTHWVLVAPCGWDFNRGRGRGWESRPLSRFCFALTLKGFWHCSATIARLSPLSGLERGGWELLPVHGCEIGRDRAFQSRSLSRRGSYSGQGAEAEIV